jgi:hypothetical protein
VATNLKAIVEVGTKLGNLFEDKRDVSAGWLMVPTSDDAKRCVFSENARLELAKDHAVGLAVNSCFVELKTRVLAAPPETIRASYFVLLRNGEVHLDAVDLRDPTGNTVTSVTNLEPKSEVAVCVGYDGKGGTPSRSPSVSTMALHKGTGAPKIVTLPTLPNQTSMRGVSSCAPLYFGYPPSGG